MAEMEAYITAADQVKSDIFVEYLSLSGFAEEVAAAKPSMKTALDHIEIFFRNAAKNKLFSERIRQSKSEPRDLDDELLPAYLTTSDMDSYDDALESIKCSKKVAYLLFTSQYEKFRISERARFGETLRRLEQECPQAAVLVYNHKKDVCECIPDEIQPTYADMAAALTRYSEALQQLLDVQRKIYQCECKLVNLFLGFLGNLLSEESDLRKSLKAPAAVKALVNTLSALRERGIEIPQNPPKITDEYINVTCSLLQEHQKNLVSEAAMIAEVSGFLGDIIYYSDERNLPDSKEKSVGGEASILGVLEDLSSTFKEWLSK